MSAGQAAGRRPAGRPVSDRVCDIAAVSFAVWTVCTHATVAAGGSLHQVLGAFAGAAALLAAAGYALARRSPAEPDEPPTAPERPRALWGLQAAGLVLGGGLAVLAVSGGDAHLVRSWWSVVLLLGLAAVPFLWIEAPTRELPIRGWRVETVLWLLAAACVALALVVHRPDLDDGFYVNVAVAAADAPDSALLARDTLLGVPGLPLHQPAHRIHTYELWNGALAYLTGIPPILVFHWLSAGCFALLLALAHARLFRLLTPAVWPWTVAALLVVLVGVGETHRWYGNFALVRIWQGKGIYLFVFMPLVYAAGIEFALRPSWSRFGLLWATQTAAVGCSSSAVWAAPAGALIAMASCLRPTLADLRRFALGALASVYVLAVGFALKGEVQQEVGALIERYTFGAQLGNALRHTLGSGHVWAAGLTTVLVAWALTPRGLAQRFAIAAPLAVWLVLLNPYWDFWVSSNLTGPSFWRSMWSLPLPILMALVLVAPLHLARDGVRRAFAGAVCVAGAAAFVAWVPAYSTLSDRNGGAADVGIRIGVPQVKAPEVAYRWAAALNAAVPPGAVVAAPPDISVWIATFPHHAHPLQTRKLYLSRHIDRLGAEEVDLRIFMTQYVGGGARDVSAPYAHFLRGLDTLGVKGVLLRNTDRAVPARLALERAGFERTVQSVDYEIWVRP